MKGRPVAIAASCIVVFLLTVYWWHTNNEHVSLSILLAPVSPGSTPNSSPAPARSFAVRDRVAAIVETRPLRSLIPLILHFANVLGPEWPILFFTRASTVRTLEAFGQGSQPFKRMVKNGRVKIIELPTHAYLENYEGVASFLASKWFWMQLEPAEHMLLFQSDSILCANSGRRAEDFFEYDFIGAPHPFFPDAFNGGLSLRNVSLSRQIVETWNIADDVVNGTGLGLYDDLWFWDKMKDLGGRFPSGEKASEFSVDFIWAEKPLGFHGLGKGPQKERTEEIYAWCPEAALAFGGVLGSDEDEKNGQPPIEDVETLGGGLLPFG
jgi:hypothetical protein